MNRDMFPIVDGGCLIGHDPEHGVHFSAAELMATFDGQGIGKGLVGSYRSIFHDIRDGVREVAAAAQAHPGRIVPVAHVHPAFYGESPGVLFKNLRDEFGVRVISLCSAPAYYGVNWREPSVQRIGKAAEALGLILQAGVLTGEDLSGVATSWGGLNVPVLIRWMAGHRYQVLASDYAVAESCPQFVFDVGNMCSVGMVQHAASRIGADRLYLATNTPRNITAAPVAMLHEADISEADRRAIAHGTLAHILGDNAGSPSPTTNAFTVGWERLRQEPKVDMHWHPDPWNLGETSVSAEAQAALLDRYHVERVIAFSSLALNYDLAGGNALMESWFERDDRMYGLIVVNPLYPEDSLAQIEKYAGHPRFVGLKSIQDLYHMELDNPAYTPLLAAAAAHHLPVLAHMPGMDRAARQHPDVTFIAAHANWGRAQRFIPITNVCFDFSTGHALQYEHQLARFIDAVGIERVLFGSDAPLLSPAWSLAKLMAAKLPDESLTRVLRANAYRIFPNLNAPHSRI
ncbi:MAG: amidohydrolase family protein [Verrucomicrobia bacterium]|nr:amidohydrolase family protein [Verrucomicrobiota bacterium]